MPLIANPLDLAIIRAYAKAKGTLALKSLEFFLMRLKTHPFNAFLTINTDDYHMLATLYGQDTPWVTNLRPRFVNGVICTSEGGVDTYYVPDDDRE